MSGQQSHRGVAHLSDRPSRAVGVIDWTLVLVNQCQCATAKRRTLVQNRRQLPDIGPHRPEERMVVRRPRDVTPSLVELEVQWDAERYGPIALRRRFPRDRCVGLATDAALPK